MPGVGLIAANAAVIAATRRAAAAALPVRKPFPSDLRVDAMSFFSLSIAICSHRRSPPARHQVARGWARRKTGCMGN
ncbi:hypothetical protein BMR85_028970 [Achromobacter sp. KAs 3-5]|nr:hypothetical protein BMR85_028970 [Achromobacter sp. KAs 3-5]